MGKLQAALEWAARGFPVFPLVPNGKVPIYEGSWYDMSTTDPDAIRAMWTDPVLRTEHDYNIGMDCTDMVVFDIDVKEGKNGVDVYARMGGTYETLVVQTPSGGYHCYFNGPDSANVQDENGVDVRSHHGFVVAPGSTINGIPYRIVKDAPVAWVPVSLERNLKEPYERREFDTLAAIDSEASLNAGKRFLETAPVAIQGQRGDETTFKTAARLVREFALSMPSAYSLMLEHWNDRCLPPWDADELWRKVENAAQYGTAEFGRLDPSVAFRTAGGIEPPPSVFDQTGAAFGNAFDISAVPPRPWLCVKLLMLAQLTILVAPGSAGKSSLSLAIAAHGALGLDFGPYKTTKPFSSIIYNGEDDVMEQTRRLYAVCAAYNLNFAEVRQRIMLLSEEDFDMKLVVMNGRNATPNDVMINSLVELASSPDVGLVVYDPLVDMHDVDEADSPQMNIVMKVMKQIARRAEVATLILHHTSKGGNAKQEERVGNIDISRGASGIVNKVRIGFTLLNASNQDAQDYGLQDRERHTWVRLDDAKMNLTLAGDEATWFRKEGVKLPNGDVVGVLKYAKLTKSDNHIRLRVADLLITTMQANGTASYTMTQAIAIIKQNEPLWSNQTDAAVRQKLEGMFTTGVQVRGITVKVTRGDGAKSPALVVIE